MAETPGGAIVARMLADLGVDTIFSVSGNQILPIFDAAADAGIRLVHTRHETTAVYAAIGASETTGRPAVALVSAGPGFLASLQGLGVASSMELPILLLSGGAPTSQRPYGAFQHLDQGAIAEATGASPMRVDRPEHIAEVLRSAWARFSGSVPRPVHVEMAADVLLAEARLATSSTVTQNLSRPSSTATSALGEIADRLKTASRPVVIARPSAARGVAGELLRELCETLRIRPLITESPRGLSDLKYADAIARLPDSDAIIIVGPADFASAFASRQALARDGFLAVLDADGDPDLMHGGDVHIRGNQTELLRVVVERIDRRSATDSGWSEMWQPAPPPASPDEDDEEGLHPLRVCEVVREMIRPEDTLVLDGGEFCQWVRLGLRDLPNRVLWNGKLGAIGGSVPMALGVATSQPPGRVIAFLGDGAAGYHLSEFETASRYGLPFVAIVGNDARWAAEWHMQASRYGPDRTFETELTWARYDTAAAGFGGIGYMADNAGDLWGALNRSLAAGVPSCINVYVRAERSPAVLRE